jgi:imidazolonepropionase-like amidohydrolase
VRTPVLIGMCALSAYLSFAQPPAVFQHANVIDVTDGGIQRDVSILIRGGLIERIAADLAAPDGAQTIDVSGTYVIPGLWDMHVHLTEPGIFKQLVASGITGVRDMYSDRPPAEYRIWRQLPLAPRIVAPGAMDAPVRAPPPGSAYVRTEDEARRAVGIIAANQADFVKVFSSLSREAYFGIADEARRIGIPFAGHVPESVTPAEAATAGQLSQEHLINILLSCSSREDELRAERQALLTDRSLSVMERARRFGWPLAQGLFDTYDPDKAARLFATFADHGIWHTPTLVVTQTYAQAKPPSSLTMLSGLPPDDYPIFTARLNQLLARYQQLVGDMHKAGVQFLAGTDAGTATGVSFGASLHDELELLAVSGMTPLEALQTATRNPALYFGLLTLMGTVEEGKTADLVFLDANPLEDIGYVRRVRAVMLRGAYYRRDDLGTARSVFAPPQ